jgi:uncharacterized protein (TIGR00725 family)
MNTHIAVVGASDATDAELATATELGRLIGSRGYVLVTGGLGGVMAAASRGAKDAGGVSVGLLPSLDRSTANEHLSAAIPTGLGELRNGLLVRSADGTIAIGGSWGTLSEIALAMRTGVPIVRIGGWSLTDEQGTSIDLPSADSAEDALRQLEATLENRAG